MRALYGTLASDLDAYQSKRNYAAFHYLEPEKLLAAIVAWNGNEWKVTIDGRIMPDCCGTIEEAYSVAEAEISRLLPEHKCGDTCRLWHAPDAD